MTTYAIVKDGVTINLVAWDGVSPYTPLGDGYLVPADKAPPMIQPEAQSDDVTRDALAELDALKAKLVEKSVLQLADVQPEEKK